MTGELAIDDLLSRMSELSASDLFLTVGAPPVYEVEKTFVPLGERPLEARDLDRLAAPFVGAERRAAFDARPDLDLAYTGPRGDRFRLSVFKQRGELAIVARRVKQVVPTLDSLSLPPALAEFALQKKGLVLVTGAAGTGKSTTLAAMIAHRNERLAGHIVTIEDPVEFVHPHRRSLVTQREVGLDTASFHDALRSALRQAPDVLLVGEVRDRETAEAALRIAETGHLVLTTLHATNTVQSVERLLSLFPADTHAHVRMVLSLSLIAAISQRLVPRSEQGARIPAVEVLVATPRVRELLRHGDLVGLRSALHAGGQGMQSFDQALHDLVVSSRVHREAALAHADSPGDLNLRFRMEERGDRQARKELRLI